MKYIVKYTGRFQKDYKKLVKRKLDVSKVHEAIEILASGNVLPGKYHDHACPETIRVPESAILGRTGC